MTRSQNVHKALECKEISTSYVSIDEYAFCVFWFFFNLSGALYEHKQILCVSVRVETTESCVLDVINSINISLMNYHQLFFRFCAKSTTIVVLCIAARRWRCRTGHHLEIVASLDWTLRSKTRKHFIAYISRIFVHLLRIDMPRRWYPLVLHDRWVV